MGFFKTAVDVTKETFTPRLDWKQNANKVNNLFSRKRTTAAVAIDVDDQEFMIRYKNVRFASASSLLFMFISLVTVPMSSSMMGFVTSIISVTLFFMFYFRYAFLMWICRDRWGKGEDLEAGVSKTTINYIRKILDNPAELLPLRLPEKGALK